MENPNELTDPRVMLDWRNAQALGIPARDGAHPLADIHLTNIEARVVEQHHRIGDLSRWNAELKKAVAEAHRWAAIGWLLLSGMVLAAAAIWML